MREDLEEKGRKLGENEKGRKRKRRRRKKRTKTRKGPQTIRAPDQRENERRPRHSGRTARDLNSHAAAETPSPRLPHREKKREKEQANHSRQPLVASPPTRHLHDPIIWFPPPPHPIQAPPTPSPPPLPHPAIPRPLSTYHKPLEGANLLLPDPPSSRPLKSTVRPTACVSSLLAPHLLPRAPPETIALVCTSLSTPCGRVHLPAPPLTSFFVQFSLIIFSSSSSLGPSFLFISFASTFSSRHFFFFLQAHVCNDI